MRNDKSTNSNNPPRTDPIIGHTFLEFFFFPPPLGPGPTFGGDGVGDTGAGEGARDSTTIEKCPCWIVEHTFPDVTLLKLGKPCKSNHTHFAIDPSGAERTFRNEIFRGLPDAMMSNSGKFVADKFEAS
jgi:hypothetical protein